MTGLLNPKSSEIGHFFGTILVVYVGKLGSAAAVDHAVASAEQRLG